MNKQSYIEKNILSNIDNKVNKNLIQIIISLSGSLLIAVSAQIVIPLGVVPITLQTFMVGLLALLFGRNTAIMAVTFYFSEIFMGLPVMSAGQVFSPASVVTFGYIIAFLPMAYILGFLADRDNVRSTKQMIFIVIIANVIVYGIGTMWLGLFTGYSFNLINIGVLPFILPDTIKMFSAVIIARLLNNK